MQQRSKDSAKALQTLALSLFQPQIHSHLKAGWYLRIFGDPAEIRTPDTLLKRQVLCRLSYWVTYPASSHTADQWGFRAGLKWQGWLDSNQR